ncbi:hypothetical protein F4804DRAFT_331852 [Jackrogersella minutella]|nr:hypothetical protein F4804DRAFT_331852 [Jackrogersella minutella]
MSSDDPSPQSASSEESEEIDLFKDGPQKPTPHDLLEMEIEDGVEDTTADETLSEPAKIDKIAALRGWFRGDTKDIDAFLAGEVDVQATAEKLARPIDASYSTGDYGRRVYAEEMTARDQRTYHSAEEALEMWGPEQDIRPPSPSTSSLPSTEGQLWELWYAILHAARRIPWTDAAGQERLLALVQALKARADPPLPADATVPLRNHWVWESGALWSEATLLGPSARECWNDGCGCAAGWTPVERRAWANINAFAARLTAAGTADFARYGSWALSAALECRPGSTASHHLAPPEVQSTLLVTLAAVWVQIAGRRMWGQRADGGVKREAGVEVALGAREKKLPWRARGLGDEVMFCSARWEFWRRRFAQEAGNEVLGDEVRGMAGEAAETIEGFLDGA